MQFGYLYPKQNNRLVNLKSEATTPSHSNECPGSMQNVSILNKWWKGDNNAFQENGPKKKKKLKET